jgi:hypothetical protein
LGGSLWPLCGDDSHGDASIALDSSPTGIDPESSFAAGNKSKIIFRREPDDLPTTVEHRSRRRAAGLELDVYQNG